MNATTRAEMHDAATALLKANPEPRQAAVRVRYRGGWPAMKWLAKKDAAAAGCLWQAAQARRPQAANDNRSDAAGMGADRRPSGKPRGPNQEPAPRSNDAYIAMRSAPPRLGDGPPPPVTLPANSAMSEQPRITIKPQRQNGDYEFFPFGRFTRCLPVIAYGAHFLGADSGLGQPRPNSRGDLRRVDEPDSPAPSEVDTVIEVILAGGNVADVGKALGATGGHADRRGGKALLAAGEWASRALCNTNSDRGIAA